MHLPLLVPYLTQANSCYDFYRFICCRCGEEIGLTWFNVDLHKRFIKIYHQLIYEIDENDQRHFQVTDPKTIKSIRRISLSLRALQALKMQKKQMQKAGLLENHTVDGYGSFVFLRDGGHLLNTGRLDMLIHRIVYEYNAGKIAEVIKTDAEPELLPNIPAYILRHTSYCLYPYGRTQRTLQEIMGHQNLAFTMKVYNHVDDKRMRDEIDKIDARRNEDKTLQSEYHRLSNFYTEFYTEKKVSLHSFYTGSLKR